MYESSCYLAEASATAVVVAAVSAWFVKYIYSNLQRDFLSFSDFFFRSVLFFCFGMSFWCRRTLQCQHRFVQIRTDHFELPSHSDTTNDEYIHILFLLLPLCAALSLPSLYYIALRLRTMQRYNQSAGEVSVRWYRISFKCCFSIFWRDRNKRTQ